MLPCTHIFFDLDGTLTDPGEGITNSVAYALSRFGISVPDRRTLYPYIGPPLLESFQRYGGLTEAQARQAVQYYRETYGVTGIFENRLYPGIPELLRALKADGRRVVMATGKPEAYARRIAEHFGIAQYFERIAGASMDETRTRKDEVIRYALAACGVDGPSEVLMIGDREHDVLGARRCGMDCLGVLYGYGSRAELESAGAAGIAESVEELGRILRIRNENILIAEGGENGFDIHDIRRFSLQGISAGRVILMPGHACDMVVQNDGDHMRPVIDNFRRAGQTAVKEGRISHHPEHGFVDA